jgi:hypothetical protein
MDDDPLLLVFDPPLVDVLRALETDLGRPLTEPEVIAARDGATCMWVSYATALKLDQSRSYHDIDAQHVWRDWMRLRTN